MLYYDVYLDNILIGCVELYDDIPDVETNLTWLQIEPEYRGNHYASEVLSYFINYLRNSGRKSITLEVPGNSPDARHIYEKLGFKKEKYLGYDSMWGGLTKMRLEL